MFVLAARDEKKWSSYWSKHKALSNKATFESLAVVILWSKIHENSESTSRELSGDTKCTRTNEKFFFFLFAAIVFGVYISAGTTRRTSKRVILDLVYAYLREDCLLEARSVYAYQTRPQRPLHQGFNTPLTSFSPIPTAST